MTSDCSAARTPSRASSSPPWAMTTSTCAGVVGRRFSRSSMRTVARDTSGLQQSDSTCTAGTASSHTVRQIPVVR